ncbi:carboxylating nicotinate-nucleotide diphosphorylase [Acetobacter ascendens]|uniref:Probable nicotinate-nucleotide pyrophosphorylase [carboxylating] n=1 Tax=Acetobacter ascendens TaxID=481146 RepID=A0A1D8QWS3_9PROT|nr:carboxylating nicotinate-nucleotide diphosphorylase [Acetobacter ascendens]AOW46763.1 nicotinate-nucleotide diphosphorylase (carboxylating) [Acetobacter ascendens]AOW49203.1 nicotinate-nucleotide diphosphorylase (carboxylating) [Acetobacter ascendens]
MSYACHLPALLWKPIIQAALLEDLGQGGDSTTQVLATPGQKIRAVFRARHQGVVAGLEGARQAFALLDEHVQFRTFTQDGERLAIGDVLAEVEGDALTVLAGERTALNILSHLSGIASQTRQMVDAVVGTKATICCTRKTLPGLRVLQKYAVKAGGGGNHRFRLDDAILIKDNHLALCGGRVDEALQKARKRAGHLMKIELEVDTLEQLEAALASGGADAYLLDNMDTDTLRKAVNMINGSAIAEASGGITHETVRAIAETGVDVISAGWLTHSVKALDIGLDYI